MPDRLIYSEQTFQGFNLRAVRWGNRKLLGTMGTMDGAQLEELTGGRQKVIVGANLKKACPEEALRAMTDGPPSLAKASPGKANESDADLVQTPEKPRLHGVKAGNPVRRTASAGATRSQGWEKSACFR